MEKTSQEKVEKRGSVKFEEIIISNLMYEQDRITTNET